MDLELTDKVVLVSGSSRGIGRAVAAAFMEEGASVAITGRHAEDVASARQECAGERQADRVTSWVGDLTNAEAIRQCVAAVAEWKGRIDLLVAVVGSGRGTAGWDVPDSEWHAMFQTNIFAATAMAHEVVPHMKAAGGGAITFVASIAGMETIAAPIHYGAAKAALIHASKGLSRVLAPSHIRVNAIAPGNILTPGGTWDSKVRADATAVQHYLSAEVPQGRLGRPDEVAGAVVFLSSSRASFITGTCLRVDGGQSRSV